MNSSTKLNTNIENIDKTFYRKPFYVTWNERYRTTK